MNGTNPIRPLKALVAMRERQAPRLEEALGQQQRLLEDRQSASAEARAHREECEAAERQARDSRAALIAAPFRADLLTSLDYAIADLAARAKQSADAGSRADEALRQQEGVVHAARQELTRNQQRIGQFKERIASLLKERENAVEEAAEEESEEQAAARQQRKKTVAHTAGAGGDA